MAWTAYARHPLLLREGELDFSTLEMVSRFNGVGSWVATLDGRSALVDRMVRPGWGIEVVNSDGTTVFSGPVDKVERDRDDRRNLVTLYGSDDNTYLADRVVHPEPATAVPPYTTNEYDVRSGTASTVLRAYVNVNAGPGALGPRQVSGLGLDPDPLVGSSITGRGRWTNLLEFLAGLAVEGGGLGFRVKQVSNALQFEVFAPTDRSGDVQFSLDKGNLASYGYSTAKSGVNYVYVGGDGEGTARTILEGQDPDEIVRWRRIEQFADRRSTTDLAELGQEVTKQLEEGKGEVAVSVIPVDLPGSSYLVDYNLGDTVSAVVDGTITDVIREVRITVTPDGPQKVQPSIGTPGYRDVLRLIRALQRIHTRVSNLERR